MHVRKAFWDYFWVARFFLRSAGILPLGGTPSMWKYLITEILAISPIFYGPYLVIPQIKYILFRSHTVDELLESIITAIAVLGGQFRWIFVIINRRKIKRLFVVYGKLWEQAISADYEIFSIWSKRARILSTTYFCAAQFSITIFVLAATVKQLSSPINSTTQYYPFSIRDDFSPSPQYEIKYTLEVMSGYLGNTFIVAADMTGTLLALNMCGQLTLIRSWLLDIPKEELTTAEGRIDQSLEVKLEKCIRRHQTVVDFCSELEETVCYISLTQIITGMYIMAISAARLMTSLETSQRFVGPLLTSTFALFFSCWPADNLSFTSSEVADAVYGLPWYHFSSRWQTTVLIMLMRSQRSVKLTAGKFVVMSLETFSSIVSSGLSFCMVLSSF